VSLKPLSAKAVIKVLVKLGFKVMRQRGSHVFLKASRWKSDCCAYTSSREDRQRIAFKNN